MIIIWKITIFIFRLGIPKFLKISITMAVDRNAVTKLQKSVKSNVEIAKWWDINPSTVWKIVKKFQETGTTLDPPGRERKRSVRPPQLLKKWEKSREETLAEAAEPWPTQPVWTNPPCTRCWGTIWGRSPSRCCIARSLRLIMCSRGPKNTEKFSSRWPTARCWTFCSQTIRKSTSNKW